MWFLIINLLWAPTNKINAEWYTDFCCQKCPPSQFCLSSSWHYFLVISWQFSALSVALAVGLAVEQTDIPLSLIQPGQVRNPFAPTSRRMKRRQLICLCSNLNKIKTLKTIWWGLTSHPARSPSKGKRLGCSPFPNKSCFLSSSDGFPKTNNGTQNQKRAVLFYVAENKYLYKQQPTLPSVSGNVQAETGQVSMNYIYQSLRLNFLDIQSRG